MHRDLLQSVAEWRLISLLFMRPEPGWKGEISAIASEVKDPRLKAAAAAGCLEGERARYDTLFFPGGKARPRWISHCRALTPGQALSEITWLYDAFAYCPNIQEAPDHVAVMAGFIAYLKLKEALGDARQAETAARCSRLFTQNYLKDLAQALVRDLEASGMTYLVAAAEALLQRAAPGEAKKRTSNPVSEKKGEPWSNPASREYHCIVDE